MVELNANHITDLARPFVGMAGQIEEFFKDPQVQQDYKDWHLRKYGRCPDEEV